MKAIFFLFASLFAIEPIVLLGGGIGSLTSAIYLGRAGMQPLVIEGPMPGGLITQSHSVQNFPGFEEIHGMELAEKIRAQAESTGARMMEGEVTAVDFSGHPLKITVGGEEVEAESCIIAMGTSSNYLNIPGEKEFWGRGVTNCAVCDGALFRGKSVCVVGGGDAAVLEALYLSKLAKDVKVFVRGTALKAGEKQRIAQLQAQKNVQIFFGTTVERIEGRDVVQNVVIKKNGKAQNIALDGVFLAIGSVPNSKIFQGALDMDAQGYIVRKNGQETSRKGVYVVGDITDREYKQAVTAAGDGAKAAIQAMHFLEGKAAPVIVRNNTVVIAAGEIEINSEEQFNQELRSDIPVAVDFYATWCGPCKRVAPEVKRYADKLAGKVKVMKVNVDKFPGLVQRYNITGMPTLIVFNRGAEQERAMGYEPIVELFQKLEKGSGRLGKIPLRSRV